MAKTKTDEKSYVFADVPLKDIFLWPENPRHKAIRDEDQIIAQLCETEDVYNLARDIVKVGLQPLERIGLIAITSKGRTAGTYKVVEGNRRVCALKLLVDPERAPAKYRNRFEKLSGQAPDLEVVNAAIFVSEAAARPWLERTHSGPQNGRGRKSWNAEQKQRFDGGSKNRLAQALLDHAQKQGSIDEGQRKRKLTTVQRFLDNREFRETLGVEIADDGSVRRTRPEADFNAMAIDFVKAAIEGKEVTSRMNAGDIRTFANKLEGRHPGLTTRVVPTDLGEPDAAPPPAKPAPKRPKPSPPPAQKNLPADDDLIKLLEQAGHQKLQSIYYSLTAIDVTKHAPLLCMGMWGFLEILTAWAGRNDGTSIDSFLAKDKIGRMIGKTGKHGGNAEYQALVRIREDGNTTKHDAQAALFDAQQLVNHMITLTPLIRALVADGVQGWPTMNGTATIPK